MLEINNLSYKIWSHILIKSLSLKASKWLFFVYWPSGSWKTTLLKIIAWIKKNYSWKIKTNWIFWFFWQNYNFLPLSAQENILLSAAIHKIKIDSKRQQYLIQYFGAENLLNKSIEMLSEWEKERIWVIKAFIHKPNLVLLDEIWNSLQNSLKERLINFFIKYSHDNIVFFISHDFYIKNLLKPTNPIYQYNFSIYKIT